MPPRGNVSITISRGAGTRETGVGFLDHMLDLLARHGRLDLDVSVKGDLETGAHHTVEDVGIVLGEALRQALGDKAGVRRFASISVPLDEALIDVALDLSQALLKLMPEAAVQQAAPGVTPRFYIAADTRTNSLLVRAENPSYVQRVRNLVANDLPHLLGCDRLFGRT